jgi:hypothetical protein
LPRAPAGGPAVTPPQRFVYGRVIAAHYFGRASVGLIRGSSQPAQLGMNAIGPFATGLWYVANRSYTVPFATFAVFFLVAGLAIALAPDPRLGPARAAAG